MFKNALRVGVSLILISSLVSCGKGSAPGPGPGDNPNPTPTPNPVITKFTADPTTNITYSGQPVSGTVRLDWQTANGKAYLKDSLVDNSGYVVVDPGFQPTSMITLKVLADGKTTAQQSMNFNVSVDSRLQLLTGTAGQSWDFDSSFVRPIGGTTWSNATSSCNLDDIYTFFPNCKFKTDWGTNTSCPNGVVTNDFTYNVNTGVLTPAAGSGQPNRQVSFSPDGTIMTQIYPLGTNEYMHRFIKKP